MGTPLEKSPKLSFAAEACDLSWDPEGLEIRLTDDHDRPLRLPWSLVLDLAQQAGASITQKALETLELTAAASAADIKRAYRDLRKVWRPDRFRSSARLRARAQIKLKQIDQAYEILKSHPPSPQGNPRTTGENDRRTAPPLARQEPVGDVTQAMPSGFPEVRVPEEALALLVHAGGVLSFPITSKTVRVGRYDPVTGGLPEIDLSRIDVHRSVSRRHARVVFDGSSFLLSEETGTLNGTFINGRRLAPGESAPLRSGDTLGFGTISVVFKVYPKRRAGSK